jgi:hypothetical protein
MYPPLSISLGVPYSELADDLAQSLFAPTAGHLIAAYLLLGAVAGSGVARDHLEELGLSDSFAEANVHTGPLVIGTSGNVWRLALSNKKAQHDRGRLGSGVNAL